MLKKQNFYYPHHKKYTAIIIITLSIKLINLANYSDQEKANLKFYRMYKYCSGNLQLH